MKKILIINSHQKYEGIADGKLNQTMVDIMKEELETMGCKVKLTTIENDYDIDEEVEKHIWADMIITQSPVYWFGSPWIHKKYIDEIFTAGLFQQRLVVDDGRTRTDPNKQYGTGGKMQGKKHMLSLTWNAPKEVFGDKDQNLFEGKTVDEIFIANTSVYKFCGAENLPSFSCHDVMKNADLIGDTERLKAHLKKILN